MKISGKQIAMARILLDLNQKDLADKLGMARKTIMRIENHQSPGSSTTLEKIKTFFENHGLQFHEGNGVKEQTGDIQILKGKDGFSQFLDNVYETCLSEGTKTNPVKIDIYNAKHSNWLKWMGDERWKNHTKRMTKIKEKMDIRILVKEGDPFFPAKDYSEYKWFPEKLWNEQSFYSYGSKLAFLNFEKDHVKVMILNQSDFTRGFQALFNIAWTSIAIQPHKKGRS